jgi:two-component sensor histidine kinase
MEPENDIPLYSSRITNTYVEYLGLKYPDVDIDDILKHAGMTRYEVEDIGHWFTQRQVDRFHEKILKETGNADIARDAGRHTASSERIGPIKQYLLGLMSLSTVYLMMGKLYSIMSRGADVVAKTKSHKMVEIIVTPRPGVHEKPYQCQNRIGTFESLANLFAAGFSKIEETSCIHKGADCCHYNITWNDPPTMLQKKIRNYVVLLSLIATSALFFVLPLHPWLIVCLSALSLCALIAYRAEHLENNDLYSTIETQGNAAKELIEEIAIRHNYALLVQKIGQITSTMMDIDQLTARVMHIIKDHLDFDRGLILLADKASSRLSYQSSYRYAETMESYLLDLSVDLIKHPQDEILIKSFNNQQPYLINNVTEYDQKHALDISFFKMFGSKACICIPIIYEKKSMGILALDNIVSKKTLAKSDMSLLMGVASQIAAGINNTITFNKLEDHKKALQKSRDLLEQRVEERTSELKQVNRELSLEIEERQKTETRLRASIKEKETLVREVYHRVKNNLQIIASLLDMTRRRAQHPETIDMLSEAHAKLYTMSLIHTQLYQSDRVDQINMGRHLRDLIEHLEQLYGQARHVAADIDTDSFYLSVTQAVPCALALNEVISNAFKYAYPGSTEGAVEISQKISNDDMVSIRVSDHGGGIPDSVDIEKTDTLGLKLVRNLIVRQLNGDLQIRNQNGTEVLISFKALFEE